MPIYEYRCSACGHEQEMLQKMSDAPLTVCPSCGKASFTKLVSAAGFQLKGSGWYATDFKGGGKRPDKADAAKTDEGAKSAGDSHVKNESPDREAAKHKDASKTKDESRPKQEAKPKEEAKAAASSGTGSPAGQ